MRNYFVLGDIMGTSAKRVFIGWTFKPISQFLNHPIFTPKGIIYFLTELTKSFWRGEFSWYYKTIACSGMDIFYAVSTAIFILTACATFLAKKKTDIQNRFEIGSSFFSLIVSVLFLAVISILFDFGSCPYPSREKPYLTSGRLVAGILIPFLVIYLEGLRCLLSFLKSSKYLLLVMIAIVIAITWSEIWISLDVFKSQYNWFHLK